MQRHGTRRNLPIRISIMGMFFGVDHQAATGERRGTRIPRFGLAAVRFGVLSFHTQLIDATRGKTNFSAHSLPLLSIETSQRRRRQRPNIGGPNA